jgi:hypothetical protein
LPPLQTPPGDEWDIVGWEWDASRELEPCAPEANGLYVVRMVGLWYLSSDGHTFPNMSAPSRAFDTFCSFFWSNPERTVYPWPVDWNLAGGNSTEPYGLIPMPPADVITPFEVIFNMYFNNPGAVEMNETVVLHRPKVKVLAPKAAFRYRNRAMGSGTGTGNP